jgi:peptidyl-tRNA hydrolase
MDDLVIQYIIVRNDMNSMTPGRCAAQAAHAANQSVKSLKEHGGNMIVDEWEKETEKGFGTTIVLQADYDQLKVLEKALMFDALDFGIVTDPEYHIEDGFTVHLFPVETCLWIFGRKSKIETYVEHLELL